MRNSGKALLGLMMQNKGVKISHRCPRSNRCSRLLAGRRAGGVSGFLKWGEGRVTSMVQAVGMA